MAMYSNEVFDAEDQMSDMDDEIKPLPTSPSETIWNRIQLVTYYDNKDSWKTMFYQNKQNFQMRFKEHFIEACKNWLSMMSDFMENDETWSALMDTKSKLYQLTEDDQEALLSAIDSRKYKLIKRIDWDRLETNLAEDSSDVSDVDGNEGEGFDE